jgi:Tfp pilus assembly major pilin PilA
MIKLAFITGFMIAAGYWFIMSATMNIAVGQVQHYEQQYQQAVALADQLADNNNASNR